jgi:hypothetical protein
MDTPGQLPRVQERLNTIQTRLNGTDQELAAIKKTVSSTCAEMLSHSSTVMKSAQEILTKIEALKQDCPNATAARSWTVFARPRDGAKSRDGLQYLAAAGSPDGT